MMANTVKGLRDYFNTPIAPCKLTDFKEFWESLDENDKDYYRNVNLQTGLPLTD